MNVQQATQIITVRVSGLWKEFFDFYDQAWKKSKKWTIVITSFFVLAAIDEIIHLVHGDGLFLDAVRLATKIFKLISNTN